MADKKISELPKINSISGSEVILPIVHDGTTQRMDVSAFAVYASQWSADTGSNTFIGNQTINGNLTLSGNGVIGGNVEVGGMITAQQYNVTYVSSSVQYQSGSTEFGDTIDDTHTITGTLILNGLAIGTAELMAFTGSQIGKDLTLSVLTSSIDSHILKQATQTGSQDLVNLGISTYTGSQNVINSSVDAHILGISTYTSSIGEINTSIDAHILAQATQTGSQDLVNLGISTYTGSQNVINASVDAHILKQATQTGSQDLVNYNISIVTSSIDAHILGISIYTASANTTNTSIDAHILAQSIQTASQDLVNLGISSVTGSLIGITNGLMAFTAALDNTYATDAQLYQLYQTTSSIHSTTASLNTQTGSQDLVNLGISSVTGSLVGITNGLMAFTASLDNTYATDAQLYQLYQTTASIHSTTQSLNTQTGSQDLVNLGISTFTGSLRSEVNGIEAYTASLKGAAIVSSSQQILNYNIFATTGSNTFIGNQTITGSLTVSGSNTFTNIGRTELTGSVEVDGDIGVYGNITVVQKTIEVLGFPTNQPAFYSEGDILLSGSLSIHVEELGQSFDVAEQFQQAFSSISFTQGELEIISSSYATTGSNIFVGNQSITGSLRLTGSLKVGDWFHGEGVTNNAPIDIRTTVDRGLNVDGTVSSDVIITAYQGAVSDKIRTMRLQGSAINIFTGDGNANTGSYIGGFNTNGLAFESGKGIDFSATSNGSGTMTSELLNDYEEGTWTPTFNAAVTTTGTPTGKYTKIGRMVYATCVFSYSDLTGADISISGLPFTNGGARQSTVTAFSGVVRATNQFFGGVVENAGNNFYIEVANSATGVSFTAHAACWYQV